MMASTSNLLAGIILLAAGLYQFTPIKRACLRIARARCCSWLKYWQPDAMGALRMVSATAATASAAAGS